MRTKLVKVVMLLSCVAVLVVTFVVPTFAASDSLGSMSGYFEGKITRLVSDEVGQNVENNCLMRFDFHQGTSAVGTVFTGMTESALEATNVFVTLYDPVNGFEAYVLHRCCVFSHGGTGAAELDYGWDLYGYNVSSGTAVEDFWIQCRWSGGDGTNVSIRYSADNDAWYTATRASICLVSNHTALQDLSLSCLVSDAGFDLHDSYSDGYLAGYDIGKNDGYVLGEQNGYYDGYQLGYDAGVLDGADASYRDGFEAGQTDAFNSTNTFKDIVVAIYDAPGRLIDSMLGFDLFGINLASLVKTLLTLSVTAVIVFFIFKMVKG